jgi:endonuclease/exonuclease/phosphatase family metal-dependent hydrolase
MQATKLKVVSYNVWFSPVRFDERCAALFSILRDSDADVICLQEALPEFVQAIASQLWVAEEGGPKYLLSGGQDSVSPYGVCMLVRPSLQPVFVFHELPTEMSRKLLTVELSIPVSWCSSPGMPVITTREKFTVGTVHLESLNTHPTRVKQLAIAAGVLASHASSLLVGDFNFCSTRNFSGKGTLENGCLQSTLPCHTDLWPALHPDLPGFTFDSEINSVIQMHEQMRYDRIMFRSEHWKAAGIELLGTRPAADYLPDGFSMAPSTGSYDLDPEKIWPSDHFGLVATLEIGGIGSSPPALSRGFNIPGKGGGSGCTVS